MLQRFESGVAHFASTCLCALDYLVSCDEIGLLFAFNFVKLTTSGLKNILPAVLPDAIFTYLCVFTFVYRIIAV